MRYESKHHYFKELAQRTHFKNIPHILAYHHQRLSCLYLNSVDDNLLLRKILTGPCKYVSI